jgi:hypothetical protein
MYNLSLAQKKLENLLYIPSQHADAMVPNCVKNHEDI